MKKRIVSLTLCAVMVLCTVVGFGMPVMAAEGEETEFVTYIDLPVLLGEDTTWQEDFQYEIEGDNIVLRRYTNYDVENLYVPATATIDGKNYTVKLNEDCTYFFSCHDSLKTIKFSKELDTSNVTNMSYMFFTCDSLRSIDISGFDTSNVTTMRSMFVDCRNLKSLDLNNFDTSNVTSMFDMFHGCDSLVSLDVSSFDTSNVTDMTRMFSYCGSLSSIDVSNFDTSSNTSFTSMFEGCSSLTHIDVSGFDLRNATSTGRMFYYCSGLKELDVSNFDTRNLTDIGAMFAGCSGLTSLDVTGFDTRNVEGMGGLFEGCSRLTSIDVSNFNTSKVWYMDEMFERCTNLTSVDISNFDLTNVIVPTWSQYGELALFKDCSSLSEIRIPLNLKAVSSLPTTYVRKDNPAEEFTFLPQNQTSSFALVRKGGAPEGVTGIILTPESKVIKAGESFTITSTVLPDSVPNKKIIWSSEKTDVATVDANGTVKGVHEGMSVITATTEDGGYTTRCLVTVLKGPPVVTNLNTRALIYNGNPQELTSEGTTTGGTLFYGLSKNAVVEPTVWSEYVPSATDIGEYHIWYKVEGDKWCDDLPPTYAGISKITEANDNVISTDDKTDEATVRDDVDGGTRDIPIEIITSGKVNRMYDPTRGEHFYTKSDEEAAYLVSTGWIHEADSDFAVVDATDDDAIPVYRLYNPNGGGMHFYTENSDEAKGLESGGWTYEGISHYVYKKSATTGTPQYRLYNPNSTNGEHNWTTNMDEYNYLRSIGWQDEGICWKIL